MFKLTIDTGNAAFEGDDRGHELARILRVVAQRLEYMGTMPEGVEGNVLDVNGNRVGAYSVSEREEEA